MKKPEEKSLGKNVPMSDVERVLTITLLESGLKSGVYKSDAFIDAYRSLKAKVVFSEKEREILVARGEKIREAAMQKGQVPPPPAPMKKVE